MDRGQTDHITSWLSAWKSTARMEFNDHHWPRSLSASSSCLEDIFSGCEITAYQRTFSGQNTVCQGILIFAWTKCQDKTLANSNKNYWKLIIISIITRILAQCPDNSICVHENFIKP